MQWGSGLKNHSCGQLRETQREKKIRFRRYCFITSSFFVNIVTVPVQFVPQVEDHAVADAGQMPVEAEDSSGPSCVSSPAS